MPMLNKTEAIKYLLWILGDKKKQEEHAQWLEKILTLSPTAEIFDGIASGEAIEKLVKWAEDQIK